MKFKCPVCGKEFHRRAILSLHKNCHTHFNYSCKICGKVFFLRYQVQQHERQHGKAKMYLKLFNYLSGMKKHSQSHYNDWPFKCKRCNSSFPKLSCLSSHLFRVHAIVRKSNRTRLSSRAMVKSAKLNRTDPTHDTALTDKAVSPAVEMINEGYNLVSSNNSLPQQVNNVGISPLKTRSGRKLIQSPKKSPVLLAKERVLRKYQRFQITGVTSRKLCLDKDPFAKKSSDSEEASSDPQMPRLKEIKVVLHDVGSHNNNNNNNNNNGVKVFNVRRISSVSSNNDIIEEPLRNEEDFSLRLSDSTDEEDNSMPHLHRVSSEEKTLDSEGCQSDFEPTIIQEDNSSISEGFKEREGLFEVLQHNTQKVKSKKVSKLEEKVTSKKRGSEEISISKKDKIQKHLSKTPNGLLFKKGNSGTISSNHHHRVGIFSMPDLMITGDWNCSQETISHGNATLPNLEDGNASLGETTSRAKDCAIPKLKLTLKRLPKSIISNGSKTSDEENRYVSLNKTDNNHEINSQHLFSSYSSEIPSTVPNLRGNYNCDNKFSQTFYYVDSPSHKGLGEAKVSESASQKSKRHHRDASSFMSDLSEFKHDREDQTEVYPDSLSSVEDLWENSQSKESSSQVPRVVNVSERRLSCPSSFVEDPPAKRRRHMTISGKGQDPRQACSVARERRRRPKTLSHRCTCCMDHGSGRKKRRRKYERKIKEFAWSIPKVLTPNQENFVTNLNRLISLRHNVYHLCKVLFPKLVNFWQLNPDTEQVDQLVKEITDITRQPGDKHQLSFAEKAQCSEVVVQSGSPHNSTGKTEQECEPNSGIRISTELPCKSSDQEYKKDNVGMHSADKNMNNVKSDDCDRIHVDDKNAHSAICRITSEVRTASPVFGKRGICQTGIGEDIVKSKCEDAGKANLTSIRDCGVHVNNVRLSAEPDMSDIVPVNVETVLPELISQSEKSDLYVASVSHRTNVSLETIQEETLCTEAHRNGPKESGPLPIHPQIKTYPAETCVENNSRQPAKGECSLWGSNANKSWESEFMKYLQGHNVNATVGKTDDITNVKGGVSEAKAPAQMLETSESVLMDCQVILCKDPHKCLTRLRTTVIHLLKLLLPNLTFENNFDKFSDDVDVLVDLVIQSNETNEVRSKAL